MIFKQYAIIAILLIMTSTMLVMLAVNWRVRVGAMAVQYLAGFWLAALVLPLGLAAVKLIVGWMVCAILAATQIENTKEEEKGDLSEGGRLFRLLMAGVGWLIVFSAAPLVAGLLPLNLVLLQAGLMLLTQGVIQLGVTRRTDRVILGLLTLLSGFELLYSVLEPSILVAGLLAVVNLGFSLLASVLLTTPTREETA
jgi:hypothetical protein